MTDATDTTGEALTREQLREHVANLVQEDVSELSDEDDLLDWGLDSMRIMTLVEKLRKQGVTIGFADLAESTTLAEWWGVLGI